MSLFKLAAKLVRIGKKAAPVVKAVVKAVKK